jgi:hypothetical protein
MGTFYHAGQLSSYGKIAPIMSPEVTENLDPVSGVSTAIQKEWQLYPNGIPLATRPDLGRRTDSVSSMTGERWIALATYNRRFTAFLTAPSKPHITSPAVPREDLLGALESALGSKYHGFCPSLNYPNILSRKDEIPLHFQIWGLERPDQKTSSNFPHKDAVLGDFNMPWAKSRMVDQDDSPVTYPSLIKASLEDRQRFFQLTANIAATLATATKKLGHNQPVIWSSFGKAPQEIQAETNLGRGVPSLEPTHLHLMVIKPEEQAVTLQQDLPSKDLLKHLAPWETYIFETFGPGISQALLRISDQTIGQDKAQVKTVNETRQWENGAVTIRRAHELEFAEPISFPNALNFITETIDQLNTAHRDVLALYEDYQKAGKPPEVLEKIGQKLTETGFDDQTATQLATMIGKIAPTYGQLVTWQKELQGEKEPDTEALARIEKRIKKYQDQREKIKDPEIRARVRPPELARMIEDRLKEPGDPTVATNLSAFFTGYWAITEYEVKEKSNQYDEIEKVKKIRFCIGAGSQKTFSEAELGTALK